MLVAPLACYAARQDLTGQSIRFLAVGMAWALSTPAVFAGIAGQVFDPRLRLAGYRSGALLAGRLLGLCALAAPFAATYALVVDSRAAHDRAAPAGSPGPGAAGLAAGPRGDVTDRSTCVATRCVGPSE
jgi:hypothetical protein